MSTRITEPAAAHVTAPLTTRRRRLTRGTVFSEVTIGSSGMDPRRSSTGYGPNQKLGKDIHHHCNQEQCEPDFDQSAEIKIACRLAKFIGNHTGHGVTGSEQRTSDLGTIADHHGYSHG